MNRNYAKMVAGEVEYAPDKIIKNHGTIISNPSSETYLEAGWKRIVDEPPAAEAGCTVEVSGWSETQESIVRIYKQVPDEPPVKPRVFSKLKLYVTVFCIFNINAS